MSGRAAPLPLIVLAASARALAECLRRADLPANGAPLLAVDAFGDDDLRAVVAGWQQLPLADFSSPDRVEAALGSVLQGSVLQSAGPATPPRADVLLGGGFDGAVEVLRALSVHYRLLNATPEAWLAARDPLLFTRLGIAAPETCLEPPGDMRGWLRKTTRSSAGMGVRTAASVAQGPLADRGTGAVYWQRRVQGTPVSLLFCAHAGGVVPAGINRQWCSPAPQMPFRFGGVAGGLDPGPEVRAMLLDAAARITAATGLRGLCSLDAVIDRHGSAQALEVNPRPGASSELYDRAAPGLMNLHRAAVRGESLPDWTPPRGSRALAVVYADVALRAGVRPVAASDWREGVTAKVGEPLCTVHAAGADAGTSQRRAAATAGRVRRCARAFATSSALSVAPASPVAPDSKDFFTMPL